MNLIVGSYLYARNHERKTPSGPSKVFDSLSRNNQPEQKEFACFEAGARSRIRVNARSVHVFFAALVLLVLPGLAAAQGGAVRSLVTQEIDETRMTTLHGNTHPLARAEFDRGAAPASLAMDHMMLVLNRSPEQEAALETLLAQQQDKTSPNYHNWLTPEQFGQQFGPSDQDIQAITSWLQSHGFQNVSVANGRTTIDFSGTAGQVQVAFHTSMHKYVLANGEEHWANSSDPQIPSALNAVVAGVHSLNNFPRKAMHHMTGVVRRSTATGKYSRVNPEFTFGPVTNYCNSPTTNCYAIGPGDFATIYNVPSTINGAMGGTGQTIAIVSDSDITLSDLTAFRSLFGLPAVNFNQIETGTDPGIQFNSTNSDEEEAILDAEWSGAIAPGATIDLVVSPTTVNTFGGDTSAEYVINCQTAAPGCTVGAVPASILSTSYGNCELMLGTSGNAFYNAEWQQAAGEGITVLAATGDSGSAGCDPTSFDTFQPAEFGLAVDGTASTPYNVAIGGTDFNDLNNPTTYFSDTAGQITSALGYIPENPYNDTCTNPVIYVAIDNDTSAQQSCNDANVADNFGNGQGFDVVGGGGGGVSSCTAPTGLNPSNCSGGYAEPSWQTGPGVPLDGFRHIPDVSLFAGDGAIQNFYVVCESDLAAFEISNSAPPPPVPCSLASPYQDFIGEGGTSVAVQAFAGIVALMDQKEGGRQGNINPLLYKLAAGASASTIFHDITSGTNAMPCITEVGVTTCTVLGGNTVGVLNGYNAGVGYDQATGLGSVNVGNLLSAVLAVTPASLPTGVANVVYPSTTLAATGGASPYTWTPTPTVGSLPPGLVLSTGGVITGTPTASGTFNFTIKVADSLSDTATASFSITINASLGVTQASLPSGVLNVAYPSTALAATGGVSPYTWTPIPTVGSLPPGLVLSTGGLIAGTPTATGTSNFTVKVTDSLGDAATGSFSITINASIVVTPPSLPVGVVNVAYPSTTLAATGGTSPYTWVVTVGSLPAGMGLSTAGVISGTPTAAGTSNFTVKVTDSLENTATSGNLTITINPALAVTPPTLPAGDVSTVYTSTTLAATGGIPPYTWTPTPTVGSLPTGLTFSAAGVISGTPTTAANYSFTLKVTDSKGNTATSGTLSIAVSSFTWSSSPITIPSPGLSGSQLVTLNVVNFTGTAILSYAVTTPPPGAYVPDNPTCIFGAPDSTNFNSSTNTFNFSAAVTGNATMMCSSSAASGTIFRPSNRPPTHGWPLATAAVSLICFFILLCVPRQRRWGFAPLAVLLIVVAVAGVGCGGSTSGSGVTNPGTTVGAYTITVTATPSIGTAQTTTITVNVN